MKYNTEKLIKPKKIEIFNTKLTENISKPKELWKSLKTLSLASIKNPLEYISFITKDNVTNINEKKIANILKKIFAH